MPTMAAWRRTHSAVSKLVCVINTAKGKRINLSETCHLPTPLIDSFDAGIPHGNYYTNLY